MGWAARTTTRTGPPMRAALVSTVTETVGVELRHVAELHHAELEHLKAEREQWQASFLRRMRWLLKGA